MPSIFISYNTADSTLANWIREDLINSRVQSWCYEPDGEPGAQIPREIEARIREADVFCVIDSARARRSAWVKRECDFAFELFRASGRPRMVVACAEAGEQWKKTELFPEQNTQRSFNFAAGTNEIRELCLFLGVNYQPPLELPRDEDFRREIDATPIDFRSRQRLIDYYKRFQGKRHTAPRVAEAYLAVIQAECADLGIALTSPVLALAVLQADADRLEEAAETFGQVSRDAPGDPRAWAGIGGALFYLGRYEEALEAYRRAKATFPRSRSPDQSAHYGQVIHNLANTLFLLGRTSEAEREMGSVGEEVAEQPAFLLLRAELSIRRGRHREAGRTLERAALLAGDDSYLGPTIAVRRAECYDATSDFGMAQAVLEDALHRFPGDPEVPRKLAQYHAEGGNARQAIRLMQMARDRSGRIKYQAEYALLLQRVGEANRALEEARACLLLPASTAEDHYFLGLAHFLLGKRQVAEAELDKSREDRTVSEWPAYAELC